MTRARTLRRTVVIGASCLAAACASTDHASESGLELGEISQAVVTQGDWSAYGAGQCVFGAQTFYKNRYGVGLKATGVQGSDIGGCKYLGACMYWVSDAARPDPGTWNRYDFGSNMPQTYDLVIYPPTGTNPYGHVASIDHMEGGDAGNQNQMYIMDSNFGGNEQKASAIHTYSLKPYGFYRLKSLDIPPKPVCPDACEGNTLSRSNCDKTDCAAQGAVCIQEGGLRCDAVPRGGLDVVSAERFSGWSQDPSSPDAGIPVHLYLGGPAGDPAAKGIAIEAKIHRDDLCANIGSCAHGFSFATPRSLLDGKPHAVHAYGIDVSGGQNRELGGSPKTLLVPPPAVPASALLRKIQGPAAFGAWKLDAFSDVAPLPSDGAKIGAWSPDAPAFPAVPEIVRADDGTDGTWAIDTGVRRRITLAPWRLDNVKTMPAPALFQLPRGADFPATPIVVEDVGPTFYVVDAPFLPAAVGGAPTSTAPVPAAPVPTAPGTTTPGTSKPGTSRPPASAAPGSGKQPAPPAPSAAPRVDGGSEETAENGCSWSGERTRQGTPGGAPALVLLGTVVVLAGRRTRAGRARP